MPARSRRQGLLHSGLEKKGCALELAGQRVGCAQGAGAAEGPAAAKWGVGAQSLRRLRGDWGQGKPWEGLRLEGARHGVKGRTEKSRETGTERMKMRGWWGLPCDMKGERTRVVGIRKSQRTGWGGRQAGVVAGVRAGGTGFPSAHPILAPPVGPPQAPSYRPLSGFPGLPLEKGLRHLCSRGRAAGPRVTGQPVTSGGTAPMSRREWAGTWGQEIDHCPLPRQGRRARRDARASQQVALGGCLDGWERREGWGAQRGRVRSATRKNPSEPLPKARATRVAVVAPSPPGRSSPGRLKAPAGRIEGAGFQLSLGNSHEETQTGKQGRLQKSSTHSYASP